MSITTSGKRRLAAGLLASLLALAACSGGSSDDSPSPRAGGDSGTGSPGTPTGGNGDCRVAADPVVVREDLAGARSGASPSLLLRFVQMSDEHVMDDDGAAVNGGSPLDPVLPLFESAQRFQDEYTDEVLNAMIGTINGCHAQQPVELVIATGDNTDLGTVAEVRRFIDNLDGDFDRVSAFEKNCLAGLLPGLIPQLGDALCTRFTGRGMADTQTVDPNPDDPTYQLLATRMLRQLLDTEQAVLGGRAADGSRDPARSTLNRAPGLPQALRCRSGTLNCPNLRLNVPYYVAFGNHDGYVRGTLVTEPGIQEVSLLTGRHYMKEQHEFIDEFFESATLPGPVGHGFNHVEPARRDDADARNDGYYAFDAGAGRFRMIVLNTIVDGTDPRLPPEIKNPFALADGTVDQAQFDWLKGELAAAQQKGQLVLVFSHHPDLTFVEFGQFGALAPGGVSAAALNAELASYPNVMAWVAGHTHMHRIRAFKVQDGQGSNGAITAPVVCKSAAPGACTGFWQIETASLIDFPQEQRLLEILDNGNGTGTIRARVLQHDFEVSKRLAERDDMCQFYLSDPAAAQKIVSDASLSALCSQGGTRDGEPTDRNVDLLFKMP
ncbi:MAG TPA: metallophosphoesterase [Nevskiales bacterium]|nr:metallophosphoesterase [Nevskiales bacterium]